MAGTILSVLHTLLNAFHMLDMIINNTYKAFTLESHKGNYPIKHSLQKVVRCMACTMLIQYLNIVYLCVQIDEYYVLDEDVTTVSLSAFIFNYTNFKTITSKTSPTNTSST